MKKSIYPPSYEGFCEFVAEQPNERHINHDRGWSSCALGEYLRDVGTTRSCMQFAEDKLPDKVRDTLARVHSARHNFPNYGKLNAYLTDYNLNAD